MPLKTALKKIRPIFIPALRIIIRYSPFESIKSIAWKNIIEPFFEFSKYSYIASTVFDQTISGNTQDQIQRYIYYFGVWEPNLTTFIKNRLKEDDVFIDVGANIGYFSLLASTLVGRTGKVIAIEASPKIYTLLGHNINRNQCSNVSALNIAVSDKEEILKVFTSPDSNIGQTSVLPNLDFTYECDISAKPLSSIVNVDDFKKARLIKIDVEGAEWSVLSGLIPMLEHARSDIEIIVELSPDRLKDTDMSVEKIILNFKELGFNPYRIKNDYSAQSYITWKKLEHPERVSSKVITKTDIVFSKEDSELI
ncbi:MAG: FkbM family methyltransferase [Methylomonas sp.]|nr:FkbM family methyltransferase [Methylomonas sp.]PPD22115.1 MAG: FkbM family methyltransferase [Methylomonas sp.]PPD42398.1 MAG: FkbM family methyltransferase [Methylomonas sp.]PPD53108.1 MAG: FkbM family methyltransferase [Methylomonas sp.]